MSIDIARAIYKAFAESDRAGAERLLAPDFRFTSPLDNGLGRAAYFAICWPNSEKIQGFDIVSFAENRERVFVTYEGKGEGGKRFRNTEVITVRDGQIAEVEVYFGWNVPHDVAAGQHKDPG